MAEILFVSILFVDIVDRLAFKVERFVINILSKSFCESIPLFAIILHPDKAGSETIVI